MCATIYLHFRHNGHHNSGSGGGGVGGPGGSRSGVVAYSEIRKGGRIGLFECLQQDLFPSPPIRISKALVEGVVGGRRSSD